MTYNFTVSITFNGEHKRDCELKLIFESTAKSVILSYD